MSGGRLAGADTVARYTMRVLHAATRGLKRPGRGGTSVFTMSGSDSSAWAWALASAFIRSAADGQQARAATLEQQWLYAEEEEKR